MKVLHVHDDGTIDASSEFTFDPVAVAEIDPELPATVERGIATRWHAVQYGVCPCGADLVVLNRAMRRKLFPRRKPQFDALITHFSGCLAMHERTRQWVYQNRRLAG